ncbi:3-deoxy-manno-octulosonate cytidylyltransferase [Thiorhodococcus mannitoliphagus]|uniref:3-deoxy-manno-octulosonate cytidylyltransferase n=1 Tax=Thiorhodococcus mannitoliphagus TaxID=329406 RepID=A0A6P1DVL5_9GAMM|nr:3-deoxy-manno-octulosonate cytidylyltransferase [Thiorhodococcus mannitoliphagus]NEX21530.1 3-deoxy-manno-octulosonate cytidylyltransferase [Thiorhodococcus mannitoliphagus]
MDKGFKVLIPARYGSTRLPGKPLLEIAGKPMIQHVVERARASEADEVVVATDDQRILDACAALGVTALLTDSAHRSGTDRVAEAMERCGWGDDTVIVNLQGDEPCMPSALISQVAAELVAADGVGIATLACPITESSVLFDPHAVKVVTSAAGLALYFSRAPIPWHRDEFLGDRAKLPTSVRFLRHIGLYAYRVSFLRRYVAFEPSPLEIAESLEQLRALWHGEPIRVGIAAEEPGPGVDTRADLARAAAYLVGT